MSFALFDQLDVEWNQNQNCLGVLNMILLFVPFCSCSNDAGGPTVRELFQMAGIFTSIGGILFAVRYFIYGLISINPSDWGIELIPVLLSVFAIALAATGILMLVIASASLIELKVRGRKAKRSDKNK